MQHPLLDQHDVIGWDVDNTLFGGLHSQFFCDYIRANQHKQHHLITFRDGLWAKEAYRDLMIYGVAAHHFTSLASCPEELHTAYAIQAHYYDPILIEEFLHWKGKTAKELGCTVLVDDLPDMVLAGCRRHGVHFIDAVMFEP